MGSEVYNRDKELKEAVVAGQRALSLLEQTRDCLNSAGNWGIWDMLGGGLLSTFMKQSKMKDAESLLQEARSALKCFQKELMDVETIAEFHIETGDFLSFADYFFDGLIVDWLVQSRISEARRQVEDAICKVRYILNQLRQM